MKNRMRDISGCIPTLHIWQGANFAANRTVGTDDRFWFVVCNSILPTNTAAIKFKHAWFIVVLMFCFLGRFYLRFLFMARNLLDVVHPTHLLVRPNFHVAIILQWLIIILTALLAHKSNCEVDSMSIETLAALITVVTFLLTVLSKVLIFLNRSIKKWLVSLIKEAKKDASDTKTSEPIHDG